MEAKPPLKQFAWQTDVGDDDLPDDRFAMHVNNARYFHFINRTFRDWYIAMGLRDPSHACAIMMVRSEYNFVREVEPPSRIECRIEVVRVGRSSMDHRVEIFDIGRGAPALAGQGIITHVHIRRKTRKSEPWTEALLALCWRSATD